MERGAAANINLDYTLCCTQLQKKLVSCYFIQLIADQKTH